MPNSIYNYASLPSDQRLELLRQGNKDVYDEEIARTKEVISAREQAGLDINEQKAWLDNIGYNYNLSNAEKMGISKDNVRQEGYADRILGGQKTPTAETIAASPAKTSGASDSDSVNGDSALDAVTKRLKANEHVQKKNLQVQYDNYIKELEERYDKYKEQAISNAEEKLPQIREALYNSGADINGGKTITEDLKFRANLNNTLANYDSEKENLISASRSELAIKLPQLDSELADRLSEEYYKYNDLLSQKDALEYQKQRDSVSDSHWDKQFDFTKEQGDIDYQKWLQEFNYQKGRDTVNDSQWQSEFDYGKSRDSVNDSQWQAEFDANTKLQNDKIALDKDKLNSDNEHWSKEYDLENKKYNTDNRKSTVNDTVSEYADFVTYLSTQVEFDPGTSDYKSIFSTGDLYKLVMNLPLTGAQKAEVLRQAGISG